MIKFKKLNKLLIIAAAMYGATGITLAQNNPVVVSGQIQSGTGTPITLDTDPTLSGNSDNSLATQKATKSYIDAHATTAPTTTTAPSPFPTTITSSTVLDIGSGSHGVGAEAAVFISATRFSILTCPILSISSGNPALVTTVSTCSIGGVLHTGDSVQFANAAPSACAGLNSGAYTISYNDSHSVFVNGFDGTLCSGVYTASSAVLGGRGNGTAHAYISPTNEVILEHPTSAGLMITCTGPCAPRQVLTPGWDADGTFGSVPVSNLTITNGAWISQTDARTPYRGVGILGAMGIADSYIAGVHTLTVDGTVARRGGDNTFTGANSFAAATRTAPNRTGVGAPTSNCAIGDTYFRTDAVAGQNLYLCTTTNTWTQQVSATTTTTTPPTTTTTSTAPYSNFQPPLGRNVGNGTGLLVYATPAPIPALPSGTCYEVTMYAYSTGTSALYKLIYGTATVAFHSQFSNAMTKYTLLICNNPGTQGTQSLYYEGVWGNGYLGCGSPAVIGVCTNTMAVDTSVPQTFKITVDSAGGGVVPMGFRVKQQ